MTQETLLWKLFPFSLIERAEQWYTHMIGSMSGDWEELRVDLYIPDDISLDIFCSGLDMKFVLDLDVAAEGLFAQKLQRKEERP
jgi:hypothetical protein